MFQSTGTEYNAEHYRLLRKFITVNFGVKLYNPIFVDSILNYPI